MDGKKFQITTFEDWTDKRQPGQTVRAGLSWEEALKHLESARDADIDFALESMKVHKFYEFHDASGRIVKLQPHTVVA